MKRARRVKITPKTRDLAPLAGCRSCGEGVSTGIKSEPLNLGNHITKRAKHVRELQAASHT